MSKRFAFPETVDEYAARTVASVVCVTAIVAVSTGELWLLALLTYGFVARVIAGPTFSPLAQFATRVVVPAIGGAKRPTPGPPKRFAQGIGAVLTLAATIAVLSGASGVATVLAVMLAIAAGLEAVVGFCLGCWIFGKLMRAGVIPEDVCEACNDLSLRLR